MTLNTLLTFMVISQVAVCAYLLYSFNTIERASKRRHEALAKHIDEALAQMEGRPGGTPRLRPRTAPVASSIPSGGEAELLHPGQA